MVSLAGHSVFPQKPIELQARWPTRSSQNFFLTENRLFLLSRLEPYIVHPVALALVEKDTCDEVSVLRPEDDAFGSKHVAKM